MSFSTDLSIVLRQGALPLPSSRTYCTSNRSASTTAGNYPFQGRSSPLHAGRLHSRCFWVCFIDHTRRLSLFTLRLHIIQATSGTLTSPCGAFILALSYTQDRTIIKFDYITAIVTADLAYFWTTTQYHNITLHITLFRPDFFAVRAPLLVQHSGYRVYSTQLVTPDLQCVSLQATSCLAIR